METKELTAEQIIEETPEIIRYGVAPDGAYFGERTRKLGFKVLAFIVFDNGRTLSAGHRILFKILRKADRKGYIKISEKLPEACSKCSGLGSLKEYGHVEGGLCFKCNGTGNN